MYLLLMFRSVIRKKTQTILLRNEDEGIEVDILSTPFVFYTDQHGNRYTTSGLQFTSTPFFLVDEWIRRDPGKGSSTNEDVTPTQCPGQQFSYTHQRLKSGGNGDDCEGQEQ